MTDQRCSPMTNVPEIREVMLALADEIEAAAALETVGKKWRRLPVGSPKLIVTALRAAAAPEAPGNVAEIVRELKNYPATDPRRTIYEPHPVGGFYCLIPVETRDKTVAALSQSSAETAALQTSRDYWKEISRKDELLKVAAEARLAEAVECIKIIAGEKDFPMADIIWEDQPDDAVMTLRFPYGQFKRLRRFLVGGSRSG